MASVDAASRATDAMPSVDASPWVQRIADIGVDEFVARYRKPRRPVILTDALRGWSALRRFTPEYFRREFSDRPVRIRGRNYRLGEVIAMQEASSVEQPAPYPCTFSDCRGLMADVMPRFACSLPNRHTSALMPKHVFDLVNHLEIFFGGPGGEFPYLHYDMLRMHAWIAQVHGDKEFTLYERGQESLLYVNPEMPWVSTVDDLHDDERYPLLRQARRHKVMLRAGEALFIPCGTWHTARCVTMNITVAFDQLEATNWREFVGDVAVEERRNGHPVRAIVLRAYLGLLGPLLGVAERFGANRRADWGVG
jgi:histone arginine demethylase JMJD6